MGYGFVLFDNAESCQRAIDEGNGYNLKGKKIYGRFETSENPRGPKGSDFQIYGGFCTYNNTVLEKIIALEINPALDYDRLDFVHHNWALCGVWLDPLFEREGRTRDKSVRQNCVRVIEPVSLVYGIRLGHICINKWIRRWAATKVK